MSSEERESLRLRIVSSPLALRRRRLVVAAVAAAVGALVLAGVGLPLYEGVFSTPAQVRDDFAVWTKRVPLPPGAHWSPLNLGEDGLYGGKAAQLIATDQATCAWFAYWRDALAAHDQARLTAAEAGIKKVRALLPIHPAGAREDAGGNTAQSLRVYDDILRQQQSGNAIGTEQYLLANC